MLMTDPAVSWCGSRLGGSDSWPMVRTPPYVGCTAGFRVGVGAAGTGVGAAMGGAFVGVAAGGATALEVGVGATAGAQLAINSPMMVKQLTKMNNFLASIGASFIFHSP